MTAFLQLQLAQSDRGLFHYRRAAFSSQLKSTVGHILANAALRITLNIDGAPIASRSHTHPSHSQTSRLLTSSLSLGVPVPRATQSLRYARRVDPSALALRLSSHGYSYVSLLFSSPSLHNKRFPPPYSVTRVARPHPCTCWSSNPQPSNSTSPEHPDLKEWPR